MERETRGILDVSMLAVSPAGAERKRWRNRRERKRILRTVSLSLSSSYILLLYVLEGYRGRMGYLVGRNKAQIRVTIREKADRETQERSTSLIAWLDELRRDGGHFEVFFTAINNPERTSFRELTQASCERKNRGAPR